MYLVEYFVVRHLDCQLLKDLFVRTLTTLLNESTLQTDALTKTFRLIQSVSLMMYVRIRKEREAENSRVINKGHFSLLLCTLMQYKTRTSIFLIFLILNSGLSLYLCNGVHSYCES